MKTNRKPRTSNPQRPTSGRRRGVLLLVVLSLLVLFALIGVTFVLVASQHLDKTRMALRDEQYGDDPRQLLDEVLAQCIRDTTDPQSVLRGHSLLADMYGNDGVKGRVRTNSGLNGSQTQRYVPQAASAGDPPTQLLDMQIDEAALSIGAGKTVNQIKAPGYLNGCVLTMLDGPAANRSTRIVGSGVVAGIFTVRVIAFDWPSSTSAEEFTNPPMSDPRTDLFLINGRPFNGTGFGLDPTADPSTVETLLNATQLVTKPDGSTQVPFPYALLPNPVFADPSNRPSSITVDVDPLTPYTQFGGIGGADEDYDAPDAQNMLLAHLAINPTINPGTGQVTTGEIIPSLHRPKTWLYVGSSPEYKSVGPAQRLIDRQVSLRPTFFDHRTFPRINVAGGPFDVDNDGNGIRESVWVDLGLGVRTAPDGHTYKPMAAILCLDLDGRLNVNTHGNVAQAHENYNTIAKPVQAGVAADGSDYTIANYLYSPGGAALPNVTLARGSGYGPAEINLAGIFEDPVQDYRDFFSGMVAEPYTDQNGNGQYDPSEPYTDQNGNFQYDPRDYEGRYGEFGTGAGYVTSLFSTPLPGNSATFNGPDDVLATLRFSGMQNNYYGTPAGSPSDLWGRAVTGIDYAGQPIYSFLKADDDASMHGLTTPRGANTLPADDELPSSPYTLNLSRKRVRAAQNLPTTNDNAFTVAELEKILRRYDGDAATLPDRLRVLVDPNGTNPNDLTRLLTTDSNDLPSPGILATRGIWGLNQVLRDQVPPQNPIPQLPLTSSHIVDLVRARMMEWLMTQRASPTPPPTFTTPITVTDLQNIDTQLNNEIADLLPRELIEGVRFDLNRPIDHSATARQDYAKYLYVLMMLLTDQGGTIVYPWAVDDGAPLAANSTELRELTARHIAQWAINVVEFRDSDAIMTAFEYDVDPFDDDGWDLAGPDRRVVWGCEYPELLLTETLAFHDRRVEDTAVGELMDPSAMPHDDDYDQVRVPQGSVFFELYCPRSVNGTQMDYPAELYTAGKLDLGRYVVGDSPVWRIVISGSTVNAPNAAANNVNTQVGMHPDIINFDPVPAASVDPLHGSVFDDPNPLNRLRFERVVWFSSQDPSVLGNVAAPITYYNKGGIISELSPGQYAVVGPRATTYLGTHATLSQPSTQKIELDTAAQTVEYTPANANPPNNTATQFSALPIICTSATDVGVSISEPVWSSPDYYAMPTDLGPIPGVNDKYTNAIDLPGDGSLANPVATAPLSIDGLFEAGMKLNYKTALLQRLADPTIAHDPTTNPYITVDWQPIDLLVFNGQPQQTADADPDDGVSAALPNNFLAGGRERGSTNPNHAYLWNTWPQQETTVNATKGAVDVFDYNINQSLGYLNKSLGTPWMPPATGLAAYTGVPDPTTAGANTFPSLPWNNRPFTSNMELLLVPATSAEQLLRNFSIPAYLGSPPDPGNQWFVPTANVLRGADPRNYHFPCKHLLNFALSNNGNTARAPYFYRLLEYVHVPSRYVGAEMVLDPGITVAEFMPPFNQVSNYRDPGRVNINTIPGRGGGTIESPVWEAILNGGPGPSWRQIVASRRGENLLGNNVAGVLPDSPTFFPHPFRSAGGAALNLPGTPPLAAEGSATMMRADPVDATRPLFQAPAGGPAYVDPDRNPFFRYQPLTRLSNLLTTRSNVYAIWVTIGFFEVEPATVSAANQDRYPDGYVLGQEVGADTGETKRHRAFYIYDRTIPVGFEPGQDHNFEEGLLLRRFIE